MAMYFFHPVFCWKVDLGWRLELYTGTAVVTACWERSLLRWPCRTIFRAFPCKRAECRSLGQEQFLGIPLVIHCAYVTLQHSIAGAYLLCRYSLDPQAKDWAAYLKQQPEYQSMHAACSMFVWLPFMHGETMEDQEV
jgi:hypothetical protein